MTFTETKDELRYYYAQWYQLGDKLTCLTQQMCPCPRVTAHFVCNCHLLAFAPFSFPITFPPPHTHSLQHTSHNDITKTQNYITGQSQIFSALSHTPFVQAYLLGLLLFDTNEANAFSSNGDFFVWTLKRLC